MTVVRSKAAAPVAMSALVLLAAGCGGAASGGADTAAHGSAGASRPIRAVIMDDAATRAAIRRVKASERHAGRHQSATVQAHPTVARATDPTKADGKEANPAAALNPCRLVSRAEAQKIIGSRVLSPSVGIQGPSCLYRAPKAKRLVSLAVQPLDVRAVSHQARSVIHVSIRGHRGLCVDAGGLQVLVPLGQGSALTVAGPCPIASGFAAQALRRLSR